MATDPVGEVLVWLTMGGAILLLFYVLVGAFVLYANFKRPNRWKLTFGWPAQARRNERYTKPRRRP